MPNPPAPQRPEPDVEALVDEVLGDCLATAYSISQRRREVPNCDCQPCADARRLLAYIATLTRRVAELEARYPASIKDLSHELEMPDA